MWSVLAALVLVLSASPASAAGGCRDVIAAEAARHVQAVTKAFAACHRRQVADCDADLRTTLRVTRAAVRLQAKVALRCCGADEVCGTGDDEALAAIGWDTGYCPN